MNKHFLRLALALTVLTPISSALAADLDPPPPPVQELRPATYDWTGTYVGVWAGSTCVDGMMTNNTTDEDYLNAGCGFKGGVLAGYNHQIDDLVLGLEMDWGKSGNITANTQTGADFEYQMDHIITGRARVGYALDDTMLFITGGGAWARGMLTDNVSGAAHELEADHWGWSVGAGVEHAVTDTFRLKMDYLYTHFNDEDYTDGCCDITGGPGSDHEVRLGAIWAF